MAEAPTERRSLRVELIAALAVVLVMAVVSLSFTAELLGQRRHRNQEIDRLRDHAAGLATLMAGHYEGRQFRRDPVLALLRQSITAQNGPIAFEVYVVRDGVPKRVDAVGMSDLPELAPPDGEAHIVTDHLETRSLVVIDEPIRVFDRGAAPVLRMVAEPSPWTLAYDWRETLIVASGVGLVLFVLGGLLLQLLVLRPLRSVEVAAGQVAEGNLEARVPEEGPTEFRALAQVFNRMTEGLREQRSRLEQQQTRLQRSEQMATIGRLSAGVAHEVGNPLAALLGYAELLLDPRAEHPLDENQRELLERIRSQTERIQLIVRQLLDFSRPGERALTRMRPMELAKELAALPSADPRAEGVALTIDGDADAEAFADAGQLRQVLLNLVLNACRAALSAEPETPRVRVAIRTGESALSIVVQDNGAGVPEDVRARLFEPFFTTEPAGEGTGLGLAISQGLVESMDGTLECLPPDTYPPIETGEPRGAAFRILLPLEGHASESLG